VGSTLWAVMWDHVLDSKTRSIFKCSIFESFIPFMILQFRGPYAGLIFIVGCFLESGATESKNRDLLLDFTNLLNLVIFKNFEKHGLRTLIGGNLQNIAPIGRFISVRFWPICGLYCWNQESISRKLFQTSVG